MSYWGPIVPEMGESFAIMQNISQKVDLPFIELSYISAIKRIGPHNKDFYDFLIGSLLGDGYLERHGNGSRLCLQQEASNKAYLLWSHEFLANRGYCNPDLPKIQERIGNKGKKRYVKRLKTWTYANLNNIQEEWYPLNKKIIPDSLILISPLSLAIWIKENGGRSGKGLKLATNCFNLAECNLLQSLLLNKELKVYLHKTGVKDQQNQYIHKGSKNTLNNIISPFIHPSKKYKQVT